MRKRVLVRGRRTPLSPRLLGAALLFALVTALLLASAGTGARTTFFKSASSAYEEPLCVSHSSLCADIYSNPGDEYVGHDEPSLEFKSSEPGSGNDITYQVPTRGSAAEAARGRLGRDLELRAAADVVVRAHAVRLRVGPGVHEDVHTGLRRERPRRNRPERSELHRQASRQRVHGAAVLRARLRPQFEGFGCAATRYCAAMTIDSLTEGQNTGTGGGQPNTPACNNYILGGIEPINWAYVTKSGVSQAPADPLFTGTFDNPNFAAVNPDFDRDLMMSPGDRITIHMHDTPAGSAST